jgi:cobaltochelatase CobS
MSATITILQQVNGETTYVNQVGKYANKNSALPFLFEQGIIPTNWRGLHDATIWRKIDGYYVCLEVVKGTLRADNETPFKILEVVKCTPAPAPAPAPIVEVSPAIAETKATTEISPEELAKQFTDADGSNPFSMMAKMIAPFVQPNYEFASSTISRMVSDAIANMRPERIEVVRTDETKIEMERQHYMFPKILNAVAQRVHIFLVGSAGSGKTTTAHNVARALSLEFYAISVGQQTTKSDIFGFIDAHSNYKQTQFRKAYENGGVFLFDEIDAGNSGVLTAINSALANGTCAFPDGMIKRHEDFVCIACGNTYGKGADRQYVGRQQLDGATLDRFAVINFDYDEDLELDICGNRSWGKEVQRLRANANKNNMRVIISPRASISGAKLLKAGFTESEVKQMLIYKGISQKEIDMLESRN